MREGKHDENGPAGRGHEGCFRQNARCCCLQKSGPLTYSFFDDVVRSDFMSIVYESSLQRVRAESCYWDLLRMGSRYTEWTCAKSEGCS